jgi:hypothetical protein
MAEKKEMPPELKEKLRARFNEDWRKELRKSFPVKERMKLPRQKMPERDPYSYVRQASGNWGL